MLGVDGIHSSRESSSSSRIQVFTEGSGCHWSYCEAKDLRVFRKMRICWLLYNCLVCLFRCKAALLKPALELICVLPREQTCFSAAFAVGVTGNLLFVWFPAGICLLVRANISMERSWLLAAAAFYLAGVRVWHRVPTSHTREAWLLRNLWGKASACRLPGCLSAGAPQSLEVHEVFCF